MFPLLLCCQYPLHEISYLPPIHEITNLLCKLILSYEYSIQLNHIVMYSFLFSSFWPCCRSMWALSSSGIEPTPPSLEAQSLNHWTAREVLHMYVPFVSDFVVACFCCFCYEVVSLYVEVCWTIYLLAGIWFVFRFWLLWAKFLWILVYKSCFEHMSCKHLFSFLE